MEHWITVKTLKTSCQTLEDRQAIELEACKAVNALRTARNELLESYPMRRINPSLGVWYIQKQIVEKIPKLDMWILK
jgi:hypothetical protein